MLLFRDTEIFIYSFYKTGTMSFFNNQRNAGIALYCIAILMILMGIIGIVYELVDDDGTVSGAVMYIGTVVAGFIYLPFGRSVMNGDLTEKFDIVCQFVRVYALVLIVEGVFSLAEDIATGIFVIIIGLICLWLYRKITDGKETFIDKIVWILLVIIFFLTIVAGLIMLFGIITIPLGIAYMIIGVFMLMAVLEDDVKAKFGM